ncbi:MAG: redoxin domain-containing protein [Candidatus Harrisonbacteria bacterium]|nr:redoxin domain-containing protein [Candidatus Harrisonbacteria bacterium]
MKFAALFFIIAFVVGVFATLNKKGILVTKETSSPKPQNLLIQTVKLPIEERAPSLRGISSWINSGPLSDVDLRGKVVLVDFWTYSCINCIRTIPHLQSWYKKYKDNGFILLGVHSPEFDFEKKIENVEAAIKKYSIVYPVALDSEHETWNAFGNQYWPAHYLIDVNGNIRYRNFGEGHYAETEAAIQNLLREARLLTLDKITEIKEPPPDTDFRSIGTPEIYLGYLRINNIGNKDANVRPGEPHIFTEPAEIEQNRFYFIGSWTIGPESSELTGENGKIILRYKANKVNIVAEARENSEIPIKIFLDGKLIPETVLVSSPRLYNLIDTVGDANWHTLEIRIPHPGFRIFTFTFG